MPVEPLPEALQQVRTLLVDAESLVSAVAAGTRRGPAPRWRRVELRYVDLKAGRRLQVTSYDDRQAHTANHALDGAAGGAVDAMLAEPYGNWHVETTTETVQLRVTKKGRALLHRTASERVATGAAHDRVKPRLLPADDPTLVALGISDHAGRVKPTRQAKYRQVEEFLRSLDAVVADARTAGVLPGPDAAEPLRLVDLGCGNAYLTFAAHAHLGRTNRVRPRLTGVDRQPELLQRNADLARGLGVGEDVTFVPAAIDTVELPDHPDVVLALHACDTATDEAIARAVRWEAPVILAAPCCHHDVAAQLRRTPAPAPYAMLTRSGILRERFADTLTDAIRSSVLQLVGYRVEVIDFVDSVHTPRNTLLRAVRTGAAPSAEARAQLDELTSTWGLTPRLPELLADRLG